MRSRLSIVCLRKKPPPPRLHTERLEIISTYQLAFRFLALSSESRVHLRASLCEHAAENGILIAQFAIHWIRKGSHIPRAFILHTEDDQLLRMLHRQRAQNDAVEKGKQRRVRADPKRDREDYHRAKQRSFPHQARTKADVLQKFLNPAHAARVATFFLPLFDSAEFQQGHTSRRLDGQPVCNAFLRSSFDVIAQFFVKFLFNVAPP